MGSRKKITISWSGGKDSAFALFKILSGGEHDVVSLHTIINIENKRVGLHGVHESLIEAQARSIGIPLIKLYLDSSESSESFEALSQSFYAQCVKEKITGVVFGDIFLEDLKTYRESLLISSGLEGIFPLWLIDSSKLIGDFINIGFQTLVCSANAAHFGKKRLGETIDNAFIRSLPIGVDACGEQGEYHTFVFDGPVFKKSIAVTKGEVVLRWYDYQKKNDDGSIEKVRATFWFQELFLRKDA